MCRQLCVFYLRVYIGEGESHVRQRLEEVGEATGSIRSCVMA